MKRITVFRDLRNKITCSKLCVTGVPERQGMETTFEEIMAGKKIKNMMKTTNHKAQKSPDPK